MSEDRELISNVRAKEMLGSVDEVHVFLNPVGMLVGADWSRKQIDKMLDNADSIEIGGDECQKMGHPIVVKHEGRFHFLEVKGWNEKVEGGE